MKIRRKGRISLGVRETLVHTFSFLDREIQHGPTLMAMRIVAEDHKVAQAMGISVQRVFRNTWAMSAILASIGGILLGSMNGINIPLANIGLKAIPAALIGGVQSIPGAVMGGLLIGLLDGLSTGYIGHGIQDVLAYIVMIIVLIFFPHGFFGLETIERV